MGRRPRDYRMCMYSRVPLSLCPPRSFSRTAGPSPSYSSRLLRPRAISRSGSCAAPIRTNSGPGCRLGRGNRAYAAADRPKRGVEGGGGGRPSGPLALSPPHRSIGECRRRSVCWAGGANPKGWMAAMGIPGGRGDSMYIRRSTPDDPAPGFPFPRLVLPWPGFRCSRPCPHRSKQPGMQPI